MLFRIGFIATGFLLAWVFFFVTILGGRIISSTTSATRQAVHREVSAPSTLKVATSKAAAPKRSRAVAPAPEPRWEP